MYKKRHFTLVELLVSLSIIGILSGLIFPSFAKSRTKAKYVRWLTYNAGFNRDSDTVINFNFEDAPYELVKDGTVSKGIKNLAVVCDAEKFDSRDYYGILHNSPEWVKGGGRWPFKSAMQFDGSDDYVEILNNYVIDFDPARDPFTVIVWANFYGLSNQYLFSKGEDLKSLQYGAYLLNDYIGGASGSSYQYWEIPTIETMRWYQIVLVNDPKEGYRLYVDGKLAGEAVKNKDKVESTKLSALQLNLGTLLQPGKENPGKGKGKGLAKVKDKNKDDPQECFRGRIDEFILLKRALSASEVERNYSMGNPY
jgi:prepilin-type N-terminal cleavage/methylation domain-containing protein